MSCDLFQFSYKNNGLIQILVYTGVQQKACKKTVRFSVYRGTAEGVQENSMFSN